MSRWMLITVKIVNYSWSSVRRKQNSKWKLFKCSISPPMNYWTFQVVDFTALSLSLLSPLQKKMKTRPQRHIHTQTNDILSSLFSFHIQTIKRSFCVLKYRNEKKRIFSNLAKFLFHTFHRIYSFNFFCVFVWSDFLSFIFFSYNNSSLLF